MAGLSQIQASFSDVEDRILLRMNTVKHTEFRFWLTRRFVNRLFPVMLETIQAIPEVAVQNTPLNRDAVIDFQRENATQNADFATPFEEDKPETDYPLGEDGILVVKGKLQQKSEDDFELSLKDKNNKGIDFTFNMDILYLLQKLLQDTLQKTDWEIPLGNSFQVPVSPENTERTLN